MNVPVFGPDTGSKRTRRADLTRSDVVFGTAGALAGRHAASMSLILHYAPDNASLILRLALEETGLPYRTALVDRAARGQDNAAFRRLNPVGRIPALETPAGVIFETGACLLWITETTRQLAPLPGEPARTAFLKWLFFLANTLHAELRMLFYPARYAPGAEAALTAQVQRNLAAHLDLLAAAVTAEDGFGGAETPLATDLYLVVMLRWMALYPQSEHGWFDLYRWPALCTLVKGIDSRPALRRCAAAEGLGETPLSAPHYPHPPEGSAT